MATVLRQSNVSVKQTFPPMDRLIMTENVANKVWELIQEEYKFGEKLRVSITGGGCSGLQYGFTFDKAVNFNDTVISKELAKEKLTDARKIGKSMAVRFLIDLMRLVYLLGAEVDLMSFVYLLGTEIDYKSDFSIIVQILVVPMSLVYFFSADSDDKFDISMAVKLLVDPISLVYLVGAEIDYKSDFQGEQFIIRNPNAKTTCGCGSSFSV